MLRIIRSEFEYNVKLMMSFFALIPIVCFYEFIISEDRIGYVLVILYGLTTFWNVRRNRERRDCLFSCLPVSFRVIAGARLIMIMACGIGLGLAYYLFHLGFHLQRPGEPTKLFAYFGIILSGFSFYFIVRDLGSSSIGYFRSNIGAFRAFSILGIIGLNALLVYSVMQTKSTGQVHWLIGFLDNVNMLADPSGNDTEIAVLLALSSLVFSGLTIITFCHRNTYLK